MFLGWTLVQIRLYFFRHLGFSIPVYLLNDSFNLFLLQDYNIQIHYSTLWFYTNLYSSLKYLNVIYLSMKKSKLCYIFILKHLWQMINFTSYRLRHSSPSASQEVVNLFNLFRILCLDSNGNLNDKHSCVG